MPKYCISTFYGHDFDPTEPTAADIDIRDIAHALSYLSRANGHFRCFYSVARHSLNAAAEAKTRGLSERVQLFCLLHDGAESYLGDLTRPLRLHMPEFTVWERKLQRLIFEKYADLAVSETEQQAVREIDDALLYHEFVCFHGRRLLETAPTLKIQIAEDGRTPAQTEQEFLAVYDKLKAK